MDKLAEWCVNHQANAVRNRMRDMESIDREGAKDRRLLLTQGAQVSLNTHFGKLGFKQSQSEGCAVDGHGELLHQELQATDVVQMPMRQHDAPDHILPFKQIVIVRQDEIHAWHVI